ncbi:MAG: glycosyltransferase [Candidatus Erginobacter occultus]|nr:glycosyltransferase [Candidatus Erginobacter occultus]
MNILELYPQVEHFPALGTYSFIAEEMTALAGLPDINIYGISACRPADFICSGVTVRAVPGLTSDMGELVRDIGYFFRNLSFFARPRSIRDIASIWQCCRLERFIEKTVARDRIDIIHSHGIWPESTGGSLAASRTGTRLIQTVRGGEILVEPSINHGRALDSFQEKMIRKTLVLADRVLGVSQAICDKAVELGADTAKVEKVAKGVDLDRFQPDRVSPELCVRYQEMKPPVVISVGGLTRRKGFDVCLRALGILYDRCLPFSLLVIGEGEEERNLRNLAESLGIADRVKFLGKVSRDDIPGYYAMSDIFCLAALQDAAPNVVMEAMASGLPIVSTLAGGIPEYVVDGETGFLVPPGDVSALAEKLEPLIVDGSLRRKMGQAGRERAEREFPYRKMVNRIAAVYRELDLARP